MGAMSDSPTCCDAPQLVESVNTLDLCSPFANFSPLARTARVRSPQVAMVLPALRSALRLASGPLQRRLAAMELIPPLEFPCRIEPLPEGCSTIDNSLYNDTQYASSWHSTDRSKELATLDLLNAARIPYFDRVWRRQLDLPPTRPGAFLEVRGRHQHRASACARAPAPAIVPAIEPNAN